jgi:hypothetical protein
MVVHVVVLYISNYVRNIIKLCLHCGDNKDHYYWYACVFSIQVITKAVFGFQPLTELFGIRAVNKVVFGIQRCHKAVFAIQGVNKVIFGIQAVNKVVFATQAVKVVFAIYKLSTKLSLGYKLSTKLYFVNTKTVSHQIWVSLVTLVFPSISAPPIYVYNFPLWAHVQVISKI